MKNKKVEVFDIIAGIVIILTVAGCLYYILTGGTNPQTSKNSVNNSKNINKQLSRIEELFYRIDNKYIGEVDYDQLGSGALAGILYTMEDPYSRYFTKEAFEKEVNPSDDNYVGIGVTLRYDEEKKGAYIVGVQPASPAANGGILVKDIITKVEDKEITDETAYYEAVNTLKGQKGTKVKVDLIRDEKKLTLELTREEIKNINVVSEIYEGIGYIRIYSFDFHVYDQFKAEYEKLYNKGIKKLIIDVRNNGGGLVDETVKIIDLLAPDGEIILKTKYKNKNDKIDKAKDGNKTDMKTVVLINNNSASASEILVSSLKDLGIASIIGETTFGKGVVQSYEGLSEGDGIAITIAEYFTKNEKKINGIGIKPDIEFIAPDNEKRLIVATPENDSMIRKAIEELNK